MGACPFCRAAVSPDLLRNGGRCPSCLIEIPGEEAPTNPGELAQAREAEQLAKAQPKRTGLFVAAGLAVAVAVVAAVGFALTDDDDFVPVVADVDVYRRAYRQINLDAAEDEQVVVAAAAPTGKPSPKPPKAGGSEPAPDMSGGPEAAPAVRPEGDGLADATPAGGNVPDLNDPSGGGAQSALLATGPVRKSGVKGIEGCGDTLLPTVRASGGHLEKALDRCYAEARGRLGEGIGATASMELAYHQTGKLSLLSLSVKGTTDKDFEACVRGLVERSQYTAICEELVVQKTVKFGAGR